MWPPYTPRWLVLRGRSDEALAQLRRMMSEGDAREILAERDAAHHPDRMRRYEQTYRSGAS